MAKNWQECTELTDCPYLNDKDAKDRASNQYVYFMKYQANKNWDLINMQITGNRGTHDAFESGAKLSIFVIKCMLEFRVSSLEIPF